MFSSASSTSNNCRPILNLNKLSSQRKEEKRALALSYLINNLFEAKSLDDCLDIAINGLSILDFFQSQISLLEKGNFVIKRNHMYKKYRFLLEKIVNREFVGHVIDQEASFVSHLMNSKTVSTIDIENSVKVKLEDVIREYLPKLSNRISLAEKVASIIPKKMNLLMVPLTYRMKVIGAVGFSDVSIQHADVQFLKNLCELLAQAFEKVQINQALKESEEKYRNIFEKASDSMIYLDKSGRIQDVNQKAIEIFGGGKDELLGRHFTQIEVLSPGDVPRLIKAFETGLTSKEVTVTILIENKEGRRIYLECFGSLMKTDGEVIGNMIIARDITQRKVAENNIKQQLMKFKLEDGNIYLVKEKAPALSQEAFKDLLKVGYNGLAISRNRKEEFHKTVVGKYEFLWLAEREKEDAVPPRFKTIEHLLEERPLKSVIYLDRLDYLITKNGFKETLFFIQHLRELTYLTGNIIIISVDPATFTKKSELVLLEKETRDVEPRFIARLSEDLIGILKFIYIQNNLGIKPNYSTVRQEMGISKPTVSKRIKNLIAASYLSEAVNGSSKVLELTQKARTLFS